MTVKAPHFAGHSTLCSKDLSGCRQRYHNISSFLVRWVRNPLVTARFLAQRFSNAHNNILNDSRHDVFGNTLQWSHNDRDGISTHRRLHFIGQLLVQAQINETSKVRVTGLCAGNSSVTSEFSNVESVSIWWRHYGWHLYQQSPPVVARLKWANPASSKWP